MTIHCLIRKIPVAHTPEEEVRQNIVDHLLSKGGYPFSLISVEKSLSSLPLVQNHKLPERRADILAFAKDKRGELVPLLLVECKAVKLTESVLRQAIGYNLYVQAPLICVANGEENKTGYFVEKEGWVFRPGIPNFQSALKLI